MDKTVVNLHKNGWCALCCSNFCYCSKESLMRQVFHCLERIKSSNAEAEELKAKSSKLLAALEDCLEGFEGTFGEEFWQSPLGIKLGGSYDKAIADFKAEPFSIARDEEL